MTHRRNKYLNLNPPPVSIWRQNLSPSFGQPQLAYSTSQANKTKERERELTHSTELEPRSAFSLLLFFTDFFPFLPFRTRLFCRRRKEGKSGLKTPLTLNPPFSPSAKRKEIIVRLGNRKSKSFSCGIGVLSIVPPI
ncbi:hypothetical protein CEXT_272521 [Caerostris extrusa]|uniref:Uncharacterized protein n=1 Tax=Caerostris extrusa TaxID=172846 RepID=A0AAV4VBM6_CAEEX|nr:hypothetical protein CEXT_272521 [Caerostris extrusa]